MTSDEGLNAYGASTWGQFFIYQGFNAQHRLDAHLVGRRQCRRVRRRRSSRGATSASTATATRCGRSTTAPVTIAYRQPDGTHGDSGRSRPSARTTARSSRSEGGKWIATALMWRPVPALEQSFLRTKADRSRRLSEGRRAAGEQLQRHAVRRPEGRDRLSPSAVRAASATTGSIIRHPVDGADPATDWQGLHALASLPHAIDPHGRLGVQHQRRPWGAAGPDSPRRGDYPRYMDQVGENERGRHATAAAHRPPRLHARAAARSPPSTAICPPSRGCCRRCVAAYDALPAATRGGGARPRRWRCCAGGTIAGATESTATSLAVLLGRYAVARSRQLRQGRADQRARLYR